MENLNLIMMETSKKCDIEHERLSLWLLLRVLMWLEVKREHDFIPERNAGETAANSS